MSAQALEFVETWVSEKIEEMGVPAEGDESQAKQWTVECLAAAQQEGIAVSEINDAFDDLTAFIEGQIEEARDRDQGDDEDDIDEDDIDDDDEEKDQ